MPYIFQGSLVYLQYSLENRRVVILLEGNYGSSDGYFVLVRSLFEMAHVRFLLVRNEKRIVSEQSNFDHRSRSVEIDDEGQRTGTSRLHLMKNYCTTFLGSNQMKFIQCKGYGLV